MAPELQARLLPHRPQAHLEIKLCLLSCKLNHLTRIHLRVKEIAKPPPAVHGIADTLMMELILTLESPLSSLSPDQRITTL
jgi:hypothetical protein